MVVKAEEESSLAENLRKQASACRFMLIVMISAACLSACATSPRQQSDLSRINAERDVMMANGNRDRR